MPTLEVFCHSSTSIPRTGIDKTNRFSKHFDISLQFDRGGLVGGGEGRLLRQDHRVRESSPGTYFYLLWAVLKKILQCTKIIIKGEKSSFYLKQKNLGTKKVCLKRNYCFHK